MTTSEHSAMEADPRTRDRVRNAQRRIQRRHMAAANLAKIQDKIDELAAHEGMHVETFTAELHGDVRITIVLKQGAQ